MFLNNNIKKTNIYFICIALSGILVNLFAGFFTNDNMVATAFLQFSILIITIIYFIVTKQNPIKLIRFKPVKISTLILLIFLMILMMPIVSLFNAISLLFAESASDSLVGLTDNKSFLVSTLVMAVMPCIIEELANRGVIYHTYRRVDVIKGILMSAVIFGAIHLNFNQFAYAFIVGIFFALVVEITNSIFSSMFMHFIMNFNSVIYIYIIIPKLQQLMYIMGFDNNIMEEASEQITTPEILNMIVVILPVAVVCTILSVLLLSFIAKLNNRLDFLKNLFEEVKLRLKGTKRNTQPIFDNKVALGLVLCAGMAILVEIVNHMYI